MKSIKPGRGPSMMGAFGSAIFGICFLNIIKRTENYYVFGNE